MCLKLNILLRLKPTKLKIAFNKIKMLAKRTINSIMNADDADNTDLS
jgi:hypothetical protein